MIPYRPRTTRSLGLTRVRGWNVKVIGITAEGSLPDDFEVEGALRAAELELPGRDGIAFVVVHRGTEALWANICWWQADILYHRLWRADLGTTDLRKVPSDGPTACVWELLAIDHERRAWIRHVLARPHDPDFIGYLAADPIVEVEAA
ncbi:hypothetical protein [Nonomuraea lactucae]|uniref:hypothetical protein n=1 Tax=Nonomuraea lactucae TaxID=2249762 RepID=UPI000DE3F22A|nr:hypothetical protein [Nonomuraea lactucae]